ncbi:MAG TPA: ribosome biogenesis GTP-binding protein YihA/YsxC [Stellaceae bacterium]|nr:ribosome biogenesis GTP-binding protein YihA/YsxC [Stellaceae bacterium]
MADHAPGAAEDVGALFPPEPAPDAAMIEAGRLLFAQECRFVAAAADESGLPPDTLPEVAILGRSNVGKSSLVNALTGRAALARVSHAPGRTRQIIFFELRRLMLADLPGYGFASAPKEEIKRWSRFVPFYVRGRAALKRTLVLIDARHGLMRADRDFMEMLDKAAVSYQIVLTKRDKVAPAELAARLEQIASELKSHVAAHPQLHVTSAHKGLGIAELRATLAALAAPPDAR